MAFRDDLEAARARIRTLDAELEAERERRQAAEAATRAAEAGRDELKQLNGLNARKPKQRWGMPLLAAACLVGLAVIAALYETARVDHAREMVELRLHSEKREVALYSELQRALQRSNQESQTKETAPSAESDVRGGWERRSYAASSKSTSTR